MEPARVPDTIEVIEQTVGHGSYEKGDRAMYGSQVLYRIAVEQQDRDRAVSAARRRVRSDRRGTSDPVTTRGLALAKIAREASVRWRRTAPSGRA